MEIVEDFVEVDVVAVVIRLLLVAGVTELVVRVEELKFCDMHMMLPGSSIQITLGSPVHC